MRDYSQNEKVLMAFVNCFSVVTIAQETGLSKSTVYRLIGDPKFMKAVNERKDAIIKETVYKLRSNLSRNVDILQQIVDDEQTAPQVRINAIQVMMNQYEKWSSTDEIISRIEALEANSYVFTTDSG